MYYSTEPWFVRHRLYPERTKTFVFGFVFVFVLAHKQPIASKLSKNLNDFKKGKLVLHSYILEVATEADMNILPKSLELFLYDFFPDFKLFPSIDFQKQNLLQ